MGFLKGENRQRQEGIMVLDRGLEKTPHFETLYQWLYYNFIYAKPVGQVEFVEKAGSSMLTHYIV